MPSFFDRGILTQSSWHGLEEVGTMPGAAAMVDAGERSGAWPIAVELADLYVTIPLAHDLQAPGKGVVASYRQHDSRCLGTVGDRYRPTEPKEWRELVDAAVEAGAKPTGAFSLQNGSKVLATFEVARDDETTTQLLILDSFDGSTKLTVGYTTIRVVCCNTLAVSLRQDGKGMARLKHTASMPEKIETLKGGIEKAIESGKSVVEMYNCAKDTVLGSDAASEVFDKLFPAPDPEKSATSQTRAHNARLDAARAARLPENQAGPAGCLANLYNAATWLVDRMVDGAKRGNGDKLDTMLTGARAKRVSEIFYQINVAMVDGGTEAMTVSDAIDAGVDADLVGKVTLGSMLEDLN